MITCTKVKRDEIGMLSEWLTTKSDARAFLTEDAQMSLAEQFRWFERMAHEEFATHWMIRDDDRCIGLLALLSINVENKRCGWSYYMHDMAEDTDELSSLLERSIYNHVFHQLKFNKVTFAAFTDNHCAINLRAANGCTQEGVLLDHVRCGDKFYDISLQCMTADMWRRACPDMKCEFIPLI
ncbi:MAG: GNAT family N-acetyltransferase [Christensenella sp.]